MTPPRIIRIHLYPDGHSLRTQGLDDIEAASVRNCIKLAGHDEYRLRAYIAEAVSVVPEVTRARVVEEPPSGVLVAGEEHDA